MKKGTIVVYESTVYPGATEEVCIPVLEQHSGLKWKTDFHVGYSPERINPGDKEHTLTQNVKVVSGDDATTLETVAQTYASVVKAGVYRTSSIKIAEAAKVIENTQRDLNIALMNELALIFNKLGIDTLEVLEAAGTKWNACQLPAWPRRGSLHRGRSLLSYAQGRKIRLPSGGHFGRPAHQRRHGQVHRRADCQAGDRQRQSDQGGKGHCARAHVQGKRTGSAQFARDRRDQRTKILRHEGVRA